MSRSDSSNPKLPKGVTLLPKPRWGRSYRASIRNGKGIEVHLGLYETPWQAAIAVRHAADLLKKPYPPLTIPTDQAPSAEAVRRISERVKRRLGLMKPPKGEPERPPDTSDLLTLFEVAIVSFWRTEAANDQGDQPGSGLLTAAERLIASAHLLFWSRAAGHPTPIEAMTRLLSRRLELSFRRSELTRAVLDDEVDDELGLARWLVYPEESQRGELCFRDAIQSSYAELFDLSKSDPGASRPAWAILLELEPPFVAERVRSAFLAMTRKAHPDRGGTAAAFVKLRKAYEEGLNACLDPSGRNRSS